MNPAYTSHTVAHYSRLKPIWLGQKAIELRTTPSSGSEDTETIGLSTKPTSKRGIYSRAITFIIFETSFLMFAFYCLLHPIPLQSHPDDGLVILPTLNITLTELKAGVTAASVVWQALACLLIGDIIAVVRSAEFMAQYYRLGGLYPGVSDRVSKLTSGLVDNIVHFVRGTPTGAFRLAFIVMLTLTAVGPLGSSTLTIGTILTTTKQQIQVTNLSLSMMSSAFIEQRIPLTMRLEREENITFKYGMGSSLSSDPVLIPWPCIDTNLSEQGILTYQSDILHFHFQCTWMPTSSGVIDYSGGLHGSLKTENGIYSLDTELPDPNTDLYGILGIGNTNVSHSTFLFLVQQWSGVPVYSAVPQKSMTLSELAFTFPMKPQTAIDGDTFQMITMTDAMLSCNPGISIIPATITLVGDSLTARRLPPSIDGSTFVGNISPDAVWLIILSLYSAISNYKPSADEMFLKVRRTTSFILEGKELPLVEQEPLSPDEMAANLDLYAQSAMKAFLSGLVLAPDGISTTLQTINQTAQITYPVAALVCSTPFLIVFAVLIGLIVLLLAALLWTIRHTELRLFDLENLTAILGSK